ncbi:MAG: C25 family cysteine peptidase [Candidatus Desulfacyla sp.]
MNSRKLAAILGLILVLCWTGVSQAAEYSHSYRFTAPTIRDMGNGTVYPEMEGCWPKTDPVGAPMLPRMTARLFIPAGEKLKSIAVACDPLLALPGPYTIAPAQPPVPASMGHLAKAAPKDPAFYDSNARYPGITHVDLGVQILKGASLAVLHLCPVQYNPVSGEIGYYPTMTVTVTTSATMTDASPMFRNRPSDRSAILSAVDNDATFLKTAVRPSMEADTAGPRQYLIITTQALKSAMQTLADHRASSAGGGYNTHIALIEDIASSVAGRDLAQKMRTYIRESYQSDGTEYVVLGGDAHGAPGSQTLPTRGCACTLDEEIKDTNIPCDLYFGCLDGPWDGNENGLWGETTDGTGGADIDWHSEVYVGRINAATPERALAQINKIIAYETSAKPYKTLMVGEVADDTPTYTGDKMDWVAEFMPQMPKSTLYDRDQSNKDWPASQLTALLSSDEFVWINHAGHSYVTNNMKLTEDSIPSITNSKYYFIYTQGCYPGAMDNRDSQGIYGYEDSIIENMVMADGRGPFAALANSRYGFYTPGKVYDTDSNLLHAYFVQEVTKGVRSLGKANQIPKPNLDLTDPVYRWIAFETNLFGDPVSELPAAAAPDPPPLRLTVDGSRVTLSWGSVLNATGYTLCYAPNPYTGPDSIRSIDMGDKTGASFDLSKGASFFVAVRAYNAFGSSGYSNIVGFEIP